MAEPTRAAELGRFALRSPRCREGAVPAASAQRPKKKAFYLLKMKPLKEPAPNNNNVSFVIHCQLGKEIKHICSNCSRGEDARDGKCRGPSGRRQAREAGRWRGWSPVWGRRRRLSLENCGDIRPPGTLRSAAQNQTRTAAEHIPLMYLLPHTRGLKQLNGQLWDFLPGRWGLGEGGLSGVALLALKRWLHLLS